MSLRWSPSSEENLDKRILMCVDEVLEAFGPRVRRALIYHMRRTYGLRRYEIPRMPEAFSSALQKIFGRVGLDVEKKIVKRISKEFELTAGQNMSLKEAVEKAAARHRSIE